MSRALSLPPNSLALFRMNIADGDEAEVVVRPLTEADADRGASLVVLGAADLEVELNGLSELATRMANSAQREPAHPTPRCCRFLAPIVP